MKIDSTLTLQLLMERNRRVAGHESKVTSENNQKGNKRVESEFIEIQVRNKKMYKNLGCI